MVNQKCERWAQALVDKLSRRLGSSYTVTKLYDTNSDVYVKVVTGAGPNNKVHAIIKLVPASPPASGQYDSLGLTQTVYTPHIAQVAFDITAAVGATETEKFIVLRDALVLGTRVELYEKDCTGSTLVIADVAAANFIYGADNTASDFGAMANL